jgi:multidrug transporter EmrE-like cation transporter
VRVALIIIYSLIVHVGKVFEEVNSASPKQVMALSPVTRVYPVTQFTNTTVPFLTGNFLSANRWLFCGSSEHVPVGVVFTVFTSVGSNLFASSFLCLKDQ